MKTPRTIQTKRTRPKPGFRMLHAATRATKKRKQRAATTAAPEDLGEVPGVGVARALVVILLLHVAAIAGIYLHNKWSESPDIKAAIPEAKKNTPPKLLPGMDRYTVTAGDNYEKIARKKGVDVTALKTANDSSVLELGMVINLPPRRSEDISPSDAVAGHINPSRNDVIPAPRSRPMIQDANQSYEGSRPGDLVPVDLNPRNAEPVAATTNKPLLLKPRRPVTPAPQPRPEPAVTGSSRSHVVKSGETLWRIAHNNGISVDELKRANPGVSASALKLGSTLVIPAKR